MNYEEILLNYANIFNKAMLLNRQFGLLDGN